MTGGRHFLAIMAFATTLLAVTSHATSRHCDRLTPECCAPRLLIIGAMKCGTNAMMAYLSKHPAFAGSWKQAEVHFFTNKNVREGLVHDSEEGRREYGRRVVCSRPGSDVWAVDKSPSYLNDPAVAEKAHRMMPSAKVVAVLCDPAERLWKEWWHNLRHGDSSRCRSLAANLTRARQSFNTEIRAEMESFEDQPQSSLAHGLYGAHLKHWVDVYGKGNVLAVDSTFGLKKRPAETVARVLRFLGLPDAGLAVEDGQFHDVYKSSHPDIHRNAWHRLHNFYASDTGSLASITGGNWTAEWRGNAPSKQGRPKQRALLENACKKPSNGLGRVAPVAKANVRLRRPRASCAPSDIARRTSRGGVVDLTGLKVAEMECLGLKTGQTVKRCEARLGCRFFRVKSRRKAVPPSQDNTSNNEISDDGLYNEDE